MNRAAVLLVLGVLLVIVSLLADRLGFGSPGMGNRQIAGIVVGLAIAVVGIVLRNRGAKGDEAA